MPRTPGYQKHNLRNVAYIKYHGKRHYLPGEYGSSESRDAYREHLKKWRGGKVADEVTTELNATDGTKIKDLVIRFQPDYVPESKQHHFRRAMETLSEVCGNLPVVEFKARHLKQWQDSLVEGGRSRKYIKDLRLFVGEFIDWLSLEEYITDERAFQLAKCKLVRQNDPRLKPSRKVTSVDDATIEKTCEYLRPVVADIVWFLRYTGARPSEILSIKPTDVDRSETTWLIQVKNHKTAHHGKCRVVAVGPKARAILAPRLFGNDYCFPSSPGVAYTKDSLRVAVVRAVNRHNRQAAENGEPVLPHWTPYQLRHSAGQTAKDELGHEAASDLLGHASPDTTSHYVQQSKERAKAVAEKVG